MIDTKYFFDKLLTFGIDFFTGVPDSLLKDFCSYITDNLNDNHTIAVNEGSAIALGAGFHLATGRIPLVYMQNSGIGNAVNPLLSLADNEVYNIPMLLVIGWRGEPGIPDEPQHLKQGKVTCSILDVMNIPYQVLKNIENEVEKQLEECFDTIKKTQAPYALVIKKDIFSSYSKTLSYKEEIISSITREDAIKEIISKRDGIFVSTTGMISRELYELRENIQPVNHEQDFLTVGSMGHASTIALSIAIQKPQINVTCLDGDGAALMHMGSIAAIGTKKPKNYCHIILNNGAHDSVGGQPTIAPFIDFKTIASSCGYNNVFRVETLDELKNIFLKEFNELTFIEVMVKKGARKDLGRPKTTPIENKNSFMKYIKNWSKN